MLIDVVAWFFRIWSDAFLSLKNYFCIFHILKGLHDLNEFQFNRWIFAKINKN